MHSWIGFHFHLMVGALRREPQWERCCRVRGLAECILLRSEWSGVDMRPRSSSSMGWSCSWDISMCSKYGMREKWGVGNFAIKLPTSRAHGGACPYLDVSPFWTSGKSRLVSLSSNPPCGFVHIRASARLLISCRGLPRQLPPVVLVDT